MVRGRWSGGAGWPSSAVGVCVPPSVKMIVQVRSHTDTKVWTKIANTTDTRHSSVRDFPDTGVSSTTLECNGRGMTRKYEVYIDMNKLHTALFHVDMLTSYFSTTSTLVVAVLNNQLTTKFSRAEKIL